MLLMMPCLRALPAQIHFAEEWNELHHLQIMESLGGDQFWVDRFMAQHAAVFYYWVVVAFFAFAPQLAYIFSEFVEVRSPVLGTGVDHFSWLLTECSSSSWSGCVFYLPSMLR